MASDNKEFKNIVKLSNKWKMCKHNNRVKIKTYSLNEFSNTFPRIIPTAVQNNIVLDKLTNSQMLTYRLPIILWQYVFVSDVAFTMELNRSSHSNEDIHNLDDYEFKYMICISIYL